VPTRREPRGQVLVALQFALIGWLAWAAGGVFVRGAAPAGAWLLALGGLALGLWAGAAQGLGNFNIHPAPRDGGRLVREGPYRWVRHPMYSALLMLAVAAAWAAHGAGTWGAVAALFAVLWAKSSLEERWMREVHPDYAAYRAGTRRLVPWLI